ncbi:chaperone modulator CbpM [Adhaeribacter terreus]|uniref:Chaperone modulator CbpM n=1 Tax=Adhaeribacter terreus TaxID=529703 RepID=A0ABW0EDK3_9BACT
MNYIEIEKFCTHHGVQVTLVREFADFGLVHLQEQEKQAFVPEEEIEKLERMIRLHSELGINKEGLEIILNMRDQLLNLNSELETIKYRLKQLEEEQNLRLFGSEENVDDL